MRILVASDVSARSEAGLRFAAILARHPDDEVLAIHGMNPAAEVVHALPSETAEEAAERRVEERLAAFQAQIERLGLADRIHPAVELIYGPDVAELLERTADEWDADLIVLSSKRASGLGGYLFGSVAQKLLRISSRAITIVPPDREDDGSATSTTSEA